MSVSVAIIKKLEEVEPHLRSVLIALLEEIERQREETVTKNEFNELKEIVRELAEAQKRTEQRVEELAEAQKRTEQKVEELAEAQKRTEQKVEELAEAQKRTEQRVEELAEAQKRTEQKVEELAEAQKRTEQRVEELAEAQKRTEQKVEELAEAQKRTEQRVEELAEAQRKTELAIIQTQSELKELVKEHTKTRIELGGLTHTIGYILENEAYKFLPTLLKKEFGIEVEESLVRRFVKDRSGRLIEMNIIGKGRQNGQKVLIVGEAKSQLSKKKISVFLRKKVRPLEGTFEGELFPILVTHMISEPDVEEYAHKKNIRRVYYSYEFI